MNTTTHDTLSELKDFVAHQAEDDAGLAPDERRYQAQLVTEVLEQEPLRPRVIKELVDDYRERVAHSLKTTS